MIQFNTKCLRCESITNLNTHMSVKVENTEYDVVLCDQHSDDTTPKMAREVVAQKLAEYASLVEKMKAFGVDMSQVSPGGIVLAQTKPEQTEAPQPQQQPEQKGSAKIIVATPRQQPKQQMTRQQPAAQGGVKVVSKQPAESSIQKSEALRIRPISGVAVGSGAQVQIEGRPSVNIGDTIQRVIEEGKRGGRIDREEKVAMPTSRVSETQTVRGRGGQPMTIPRVIKHNQGTTVINVVDTGGDQTIQQRFRTLAAQGMNDNKKIYNFGDPRQGYDVMNCTLCGGTGITASNGESCPKCKGTGILNKGWGG